jgi:uncharacterized protein (TIGR03437 family)
LPRCGALSGAVPEAAVVCKLAVESGVGPPHIPAGQIVTQLNQLVAPLQILFGPTAASVTYSGLAPNFVGLYQFNVTVPAVADNDAIPLTFSARCRSGNPDALDLPRLFQPVLTEDFSIAANSFGVR